VLFILLSCVRPIEVIIPRIIRNRIYHQESRLRIKEMLLLRSPFCLQVSESLASISCKAAVAYSPKRGRYLRATSAIQRGEIVALEQPLLSFPLAGYCCHNFASKDVHILGHFSRTLTANDFSPLGTCR
jgi:hypothetical protein